MVLAQTPGRLTPPGYEGSMPMPKASVNGELIWTWPGYATTIVLDEVDRLRVGGVPR